MNKLKDSTRQQAIRMLKQGINSEEIHYECDACGRGWLLPTGEVYRNVSPMQFEHKCNYCGAKKIVEGRTYPYTITSNGRMM